MMKTKLFFTGILGIGLLAMAAPHTWTLKNGNKFEGDYFSSGTEKVVVRKNGTNYIFKIEDLSREDQTFIAKSKAGQKQAMGRCNGADHSSGKETRAVNEGS